MIYNIIIRNLSITASCTYGECVDTADTLSDRTHEVYKGRRYSCNATPDQQYEPICIYCKGNKSRKYWNEIRQNTVDIIAKTR